MLRKDVDVLLAVMKRRNTGRDGSSTKEKEEIRRRSIINSLKRHENVKNPENSKQIL